MTSVWHSVHTEIESSISDIHDEEGYGLLHLEMIPVGTQLPKDQQTRELRITIMDDPQASPGETMTVLLDENGIAALAAFLKEKP